MWLDTTNTDPKTHLAPMCLPSIPGKTKVNGEENGSKYCAKSAKGLAGSNSHVSFAVTPAFKREGPDGDDCPDVADTHPLRGGEACEKMFQAVVDKCTSLLRPCFPSRSPSPVLTLALVLPWRLSHIADR